MARGGGESGMRDLDRTPTWAVALVVAVIIIISIILEKFLHKVQAAFKRKRKVALLEALEIIKAELMILGFISLLLTFGQNYIARICIPHELGDTFLPCKLDPGGETKEHHRRLLYEGRMLAADSAATTCKKGYVPLISVNGLHQLHIFIFFLAIFHVFYSNITMTLGRQKTRGWKHWENEILNAASDDEFRLTKEISFIKGHGHSSSWMNFPVVFYLVCFIRHTLYSVQKSDYMTLRHGFITVHLAPGTKFNFQKYLKRSLEDDYKVVVGIPPFLWMTAVVYLLVNVHGSQAMFGLSVMPVIIILAVGTKLQSIITRMAIEIQERHVVVQGIPLVEVSDKHFWFGRPTLILHLLHLVLFQNAFDITYFMWTTYEFGYNSCFNDDFRLALLRVFIGVGVQFLCSYVTLPLYALVTQMGSHMKRSIFDEQTAKALKSWHKKVKKKSEKAGQLPEESSEHSSHSKTVSGSKESNQNVKVDIPGESRIPQSGNRDLIEP